MTALADTNGHTQLRSDGFADRDKHLADVLEAEVDDLRALLDDELKGRDELAQLLERSRERERRLTRAIAVLEGGVNQQAPRKTAATAAAKEPKGGWEVSSATVERVHAAFLRYWNEEANGQPFTQTTLATWLGQHGQGIGGDTIRKAMHTLRDRELVRKCGTTRGGGKLWAPMPEGS
jgi:hypothetical protein